MGRSEIRMLIKFGNVYDQQLRAVYILETTPAQAKEKGSCTRIQVHSGKLEL